MATMSSRHVPGRGEFEPTVSGTSSSSDPLDSLRTMFLDTSRVSHFAECLAGLKASRETRETTIGELRAKHTNGSALTKGERALLDVENRVGVHVAAHAALREIDALERQMQIWDRRRFRDAPRFGDDALGVCRARVATAKEDFIRAVALNQPMILEAKRRAREEERLRLEQRVEQSKQRQREARYEFDADLVAGRRNETIERELTREHTKEKEQLRELHKRREVHGVVHVGDSRGVTDIHPSNADFAPQNATQISVDTSQNKSTRLSESSTFLDDTNELSLDMEEKRAAWNNELERRRSLLEEERRENEVTQKQIASTSVPTGRSGFSVPAERRAMVLATLFNHALGCGISDDNTKISPDVVAKALVAAESGANAGDARLGSDGAVARNAALAVLRANSYTDQDTPVPVAFCYGRGSGETYMSAPGPEFELTSPDALCALKELRTSQSVFGNATFMETFSYFGKLVDRSRSRDASSDASSNFAALLTPQASGSDASNKYLAAKKKLATLVQTLWTLDDPTGNPPVGHAPYWASKSEKAKSVVSNLASKAKASKPGAVQSPLKKMKEPVPVVSNSVAGLLGDLDLGVDEPPKPSTNPFSSGSRVTTSRPSSAKGKLNLNLRESSAFVSAKDEVDLDQSDELEAALRALPSPTARRILGAEETVFRATESAEKDTTATTIPVQEPALKPSVPNPSNPTRNPISTQPHDAVPDEFSLNDSFESELSVHPTDTTSSEFDFTVPSPQRQGQGEEEKESTTRQQQQGTSSVPELNAARPLPGGPRRRPGGGTNPNPVHGIISRALAADDSDSSMSDLSGFGQGGGANRRDESDSFDF